MGNGQRSPEGGVAALELGRYPRVMNHLVLGGTGTVGSAVVRGLLGRGETVRVLTRSAEKSRSLPRGAQGVVGDLMDPDAYDTIFSNAENVFILNAVSPTELHEGLAAINESRRRRAKRVVYLSIFDVEKAPHVPHFAAKLAGERAIKESGIPYTILRPSGFFQNDYWYQQVILQHGVYPDPIGSMGVSRVDVRDIADAAVNALTRSGFENRTYAIVGSQPLRGQDCARAYSQALGREIRYGGDDLESFAKQVRQMVPAWLVYDLILMNEVFQEKGFAATPGQIEEAKSIVGHAARRYEDFAGETASIWTRTGEQPSATPIS